MPTLTGITHREALAVLASRLGTVIEPYADRLVKVAVTNTRCVVERGDAHIVVNLNYEDALHYMSRGLTDHQQEAGVLLTYDFFRTADYRKLSLEFRAAEPNPMNNPLLSRFARRQDDGTRHNVFYELCKEQQ